MGNARLDLDFAEGEQLPFVDHEGDVETRTVACQLGAGRYDTSIRVAVLHVVLAQKLAIQRQPVGIVDVGALQEVEPARLARGDDVPEVGIGERLVADDIDRLNLGRAALVNFEDNVHAIAVQLDDLGFHRGSEPALAPVDVQNPLHVGLRLGAREDRPRLDLHFVGESSLVDFLVALEGHLIDDGILDDSDHNARAFAINANVGKQAGGEQGANRLIDFAGVVGVTGVEPQVRADGFGLDAPITHHANFADGGALRLRAMCRIEDRFHNGQRTERDHRSHDEVPVPRLARPVSWHTSRLPFGRR